MYTPDVIFKFVKLRERLRLKQITLHSQTVAQNIIYNKLVE